MNALPPTPTMDVVAQALADRTRRSILQLTRDCERSAGELAAGFPAMSRPAVSQHLAVLHAAGLVSMRRDGRRRLYRTRAEGLTEMWRYLDEMWAGRLARLQLAAERAERPDQRRHHLDRNAGSTR